VLLEPEDVKMVFVERNALTLMVVHLVNLYNVQTVSVLWMNLSALVRVIVLLIDLSVV